MSKSKKPKKAKKDKRPPAACWTFRRRSRSAWPRAAPSGSRCRWRPTASGRRPDDRPDPVGILEAQNATRVPELVPIRHGRMIVSPFTFYRGSAAIMASDLASHPDDGVARAVLRRCAPVELRHLRGAGPPARVRPQRLRRDAAGAVRVGRQAPGGEHRRRRPRQRPSPQGAARGGARRRRRLPDGDGQGGARCASWTSGTRGSTPTRCSRSSPRPPTRPRSRPPGRCSEKAEKRTSLGSLSKFAERVDGGYRIKQQPPVIVRPPETLTEEFERDRRPGAHRLRELARPRSAGRARPLPLRGFARKVVGVGSVGTEALMILLMGDREDDPLFLQVKEATTSVLAPSGRQRVRAPGRAGGARPAAHAGRKRRVPRLVHRSRREHARVLRPPAARQEGLGRGRADEARGAWRPTASSAAATLARAHARTGDAAKITGYLGDDDTFDRALERFAVAYADQNDADYAAFTQAADEQRIEVERGV